MMGSGSGGGGGGGSGSQSSGGVGYSVSGGAGGGRPQLVRNKDDPINEIFNSALSGPPKEHYLGIFASDLVLSLYQALLSVSVSLCLNRDWKEIEETYQVPGQAGCLSRLKDAMLEMHGGEGADPLAREICGEALEHFFIFAMGDSPMSYTRADADQVIQRVDRRVLVESRSSFFLRELISEVAQRRCAELTPDLKNDFHAHSLDRADLIVAKFEARFKAKDPEMTHNKIFQVIRNHPDWFLDLLKKGTS